MRPRSKTTRRDDGNAFLPDDLAGMGGRDTLAELVGEGFVHSATAAREIFDDKRNEITADELGGPFVEVDAYEELGMETDESNPLDATQEAFPSALRGRPD